MITQEKGRIGEEKALTYLIAQGLKLVNKNYTCRLGEIDLIMQDKDHLVFVEVRSRVSVNFGGGLASITYSKRQKIIKAASYYAMTHKNPSQLAMRFDVISIDGKVANISWIKDAFGVDY